MTTERERDARTRPAGIREVAERAGVSMSSVSRVLSDHPDVSVIMRNRVLDAVAALGYEPHFLAQSLRTGATMSVGFIASDIGNPLFAEIAQGAERTLRARGYSMLLANAFSDAALGAAHVRSMLQRRVDGMLISISDETDPQMQDVLRRCNVPVVLLDREFDSLPAVLSDHAHGIEAAVERLIELGHRRIALVNGASHVRPSRERAQAIRRIARKHPEVSVNVRMGSFSPDHGEATTRDLMESRSAPTAIIAGSNQILIGVLRGLRDLGKSIPGDVSLVTCDDVALAEFLQPPLTTISRDASALGAVAADLILNAMGGASIESVVLPTGFRETASCAAPFVPGSE